MSPDSTIQHYIQRYPHHEEALRNLQRLLAYQTDLAHRVEPGWKIDRAAALAQWRVGRPLLADNPMPVAPVLFLDALAGLQTLLGAASPLAQTLERMLQTEELAPTRVATFLEALPAASRQQLTMLADESESVFEHVATLVRTALSPLLARQAAPARAWLPQSKWKGTICPICGAAPEMDRLDKASGQRFLACFWCQSEWSFPRLRCHHCQKEDGEGLSYFVLEEDQAHRVTCCDSCHHYIKTVDERHLDYTPILLVEDFLTAHLDELARAEGCL